MGGTQLVPDRGAGVRRSSLMNLGGWEWVILAVVALVLFGGAKLATFGKNAGKAIREFKEESGVGEKKLPPAADKTSSEPDDSTPA
jgi:sec-independent protein translocase protein TatA